MKNLHNNALLLLFSILTTFVFSKSFKEINELRYDQLTKKELIRLSRQEQTLYKQNGSKENYYNYCFLKFKLLELEQGRLDVKLTLLLKMEEDAEKSNIPLFQVRVLDELSILVNSYSTKQGDYYNKKLLHIARTNKIKYYIYRGYSQIATYYTYDKINYKKAIAYWDSCFMTLPKTDYLHRSSMLNNEAICYNYNGQIMESIRFNRRAARILKQLRMKSKDDIFFEKIIDGNYGDLLLSKGSYAPARLIFEDVFDYFKKSTSGKGASINTAENLLTIYSKTNQNSKASEIITYLLKALAEEQNLNSQQNILEILQKYYHQKHDFERMSFYANELLNVTNQLVTQKIKAKDEFSEVMTKNLIKSLKKNIEKESESQRRRNNILIITLFFIVLALAIVIYYQQRVNLKTNKIKKQTLEIKEKNQQIIDKELKLQQEKITHLQLNLNLKTGAEKAFLQKLKEIKKKNNQSVEEVVNDLQFQISNLLQIDKKNYETNTQLKNEEKLFYDKLKARHQELSKIDIQFCSYFRIDLSSKEIALLEDIAPNSVRVYKNRIKNKIGLSVDDNLNEYLKKI